MRRCCALLALGAPTYAPHDVLHVLQIADLAATRASSPALDLDAPEVRAGPHLGTCLCAYTCAANLMYGQSNVWPIQGPNCICCGHCLGSIIWAAYGGHCPVSD